MKLASSITVSALGGALLMIGACSSGENDNAKATSAEMEAFAEAECAEEQRCSPVELAVQLGDLNGCIAAAKQSLEATLALAGVTVTNAQLTACTSATKAGLCEVESDQIPACNFTGSLANGAVCAIDTQCASGNCDTDGVTVDDAHFNGVFCGKCAPFLADGAPCGSGRCNIGSTCDSTTKACAPRIAKGAACTAEGLSCQAGLFCLKNVCSSPIAIGAACDVSDPDVGACFVGGACRNGTCVALSTLVTIADIGQPCGVDATTQEGIDCKNGSCMGPAGAQKCVAYATTGQPCNDGSGDPSLAANPKCALGLYCENSACVNEDASLCK